MPKPLTIALAILSLVAGYGIYILWTSSRFTDPIFHLDPIIIGLIGAMAVFVSLFFLTKKSD